MKPGLARRSQSHVGTWTSAGFKPLHGGVTPAEPSALDTPPTEWGVEYRFADEPDTRTHLHIPDPPSRENAMAHAERLTAEGGYSAAVSVGPVVPNAALRPTHGLSSVRGEIDPRSPCLSRARQVAHW